MISTEKAFDMLPNVAEIYDKLDMDTYIKNEKEKNNIKDIKNLDIEILGIGIFKHIMKNSKKVKEEVFEIVSIFEEREIEEVKKQSLGKTLKTLKSIFNDEETVDFFKSAMN